MEPTVIQTVDACLGIATCLIRLSDFVIRLKNAGELAKTLCDKVNHVSTVLRSVRETLRARSERRKAERFESEEELHVDGVSKCIRRCRKSLEVLFKDVFGTSLKTLSKEADGDVVKAPSKLNDSKLQRAKIAFNPQRVIDLKQDLGFQLSMLQISLQALSVFDISSMQEQQSRSHARLDQCLEELRNLIDDGYTFRDNPHAISTSSKAISDLESTSDVDSGVRVDFEGTDIAAGDLEECLRDAEETWERMKTVTEEISDAGQARQTPPAAVATENVSTPAVGGEFDGVVVEGFESLDDLNNLTRKPSYSLPLLLSIVQDYRARAQANRLTGDWLQAWRDIEKVIQYSYECRKYDEKFFADELEVYETLVTILIKLRWWNLALHRIDRLRNYSSTSDQSQDNTTARKSTISYLRALVLFDRSKNSIATATADRSNARDAAQDAFSVADNLLSRCPQTEAELRRFRQSGLLLADICVGLNEEIEAEHIRSRVQQRTASKSSPGRSEGTALAPNALLDQSDGIPQSSTQVIHDIEKKDADGSTILIRTVQKGDEHSVMELLRDHPTANIDVEDRKGYTALHHAANLTNCTIAKSLLHFGASVNKRTKDWKTALLFAVKKQNEELVEMLLDNGADTALSYGDDCTILHISIRYSTLNITRLLLSKGDPTDLIDRQDRFGGTALHHSVEYGKVKQAEVLLENFADVNGKAFAERNLAQDTEKHDTPPYTPMFIALGKPHVAANEAEALVNLLLDYQPQDDVSAYPKEYKEYQKRYGVYTNRRRRGSTTSGSIGTISTIS